MSNKPKLAMFWGASCGGCEIALVNLHERLLDVDEAFDFMFCPCLMDTKLRDIEALPDRGIALTLFNGAIRTAENEEMAHLMRRKSQLLIAFGACAKGGSIPALSNLHAPVDHFASIYLDNPTVENHSLIFPQTETSMPEGELQLPAFYGRVKSLSQVVDVDYVIPGCPPEPHQIWNAIELVLQGGPLPPRGSVLGTGQTTVCEECDRRKEDKKITRFYRTWEIIPDTERCLLEQGLVCMGIATRDGCGALCPQANMPCSGCYGAPEGVLDQGAKMVAALGSIIDIDALKGLPESEITAHIDKVLGSIPDYAGTFYKFTLAESLLKGTVRR
ncbi:MAG: NADH:ubiquinone oxidoreductase [Geobacter sp.]|nr:MAG: NADH:ubiquinone oxidoreductase [Geobacter sp.]